MRAGSSLAKSRSFSTRRTGADLRLVPGDIAEILVCETGKEHEALVDLGRPVFAKDLAEDAADLAGRRVRLDGVD